MRCLLITATALSDEEGCADALGKLRDAGLAPVLLGHPNPPDAGAFADTPRLRLSEPPEQGTAAPILQAAALGGASPSEAFMICDDLATGLAAEALGSRSILVLGGRPLDAVLGPGEPANKALATAPTLLDALRYVREEHSLNQKLGGFPYGGQHPLETGRSISGPSGPDLAKIFGLSVVAGLAVALGIAYLLQEVYDTLRFPRVFYYLTLQFIPQTLRGLLFLLIGTGAGLLLPRLLSSLSREPRG
jgi:hypothetical protein